MAQIKLNSKIVIEACEKVLKINHNLKDRLNILDIKDLAECAFVYGTGVCLDSNDFYLIGEYLPKPTTYSSHPESGTIKCIRCDKEWVAGQQKCLKCGSLYSN